jgi:hypothetical protein
MDRVRQFLVDLKQRELTRGNFLGFLNVLIGRQVTQRDGTPVSSGLTWRELAAQLKKVRWDRDAVRDLGVDPATLPPRDRQRFWYAAIVQAQVDSARAMQAGDQLAKRLRGAGYNVGSGPPHQR